MRNADIRAKMALQTKASMSPQYSTSHFPGRQIGAEFGFMGQAMARGFGMWFSGLGESVNVSEETHPAPPPKKNTHQPNGGLRRWTRHQPWSMGKGIGQRANGGSGLSPPGPRRPPLFCGSLWRAVEWTPRGSGLARSDGEVGSPFHCDPQKCT